MNLLFVGTMTWVPMVLEQESEDDFNGTKPQTSVEVLPGPDEMNSSFEAERAYALKTLVMSQTHRMKKLSGLMLC